MNPEVIGWIATTLVVLVVVGFVVHKLIQYGEQSQASFEHEQILHDLQYRLDYTFGVELDTIHEITTQDEIVRIVNLQAHKTAATCVNEDRYQRGKGGNSCGCAGGEKKTWSEMRNLALQILPDLKDRLPHFSEFEPLKSYNAKHLLKKAAKQAKRAEQPTT